MAPKNPPGRIILGHTGSLRKPASELVPERSQQGRHSSITWCEPSPSVLRTEPIPHPLPRYTRFLPIHPPHLGLPVRITPWGRKLQAVEKRRGKISKPSTVLLHCLGIHSVTQGKMWLPPETRQTAVKSQKCTDIDKVYFLSRMRSYRFMVQSFKHGFTLRLVLQVPQNHLEGPDLCF